MTIAICFSKNRACQLDLLLRSIEEHASGLYSRVHVIWKGDNAYAAAYRICAQDHPWAEFERETDLCAQTLALLERAETAAFLMDDCVFYRNINGQRRPENILADDEDVLCFSPRLGLNTKQCYPLRREQVRPLASAEDNVMYWDWADADGDFAYPMSLDGHVFRGDDLRALLPNVLDWSTPNTLEAELARMAWDLNRPMMAAGELSCLVGVPANRVGVTHSSNRFGETFAYPAHELNSRYLEGKQIQLDSINPDRVDAAHAESGFKFA